ncbi:histidine phosphatase family protein [Albimonas sp. CAU 1670]|uniref:SixA phosphatase family protein n=1 Tax=Albimonas sp. CAU 1670 TaxID=3032599 RepID=UPI0023D9EDC0|nr:histidine phosphatase family protein [Albimonas sp. CAU 1670]MDF2231346.1 histidine phosphatase family protein [Albimonas sp. CAU 1670]
MPRLVLFRHAKSAWDDPDLPDLDRPLARRGRLAATLMGGFLAEEGLRPDLVLLSPALRTRETWRRACAAAGFEPPARSRIVPDLYMADPDTALGVLQEEGGEAEVVLMLGHEPGTSALLRRLHGGRPPEGLARAFEKFPTGAVAVIDLPRPWAETFWGQGVFARFATPKDLV